MPRPPFERRHALALAALLALAPLPGAALAPGIALMIKQMVQQSVTSMVKDSLLGSLRGMGCKGIALSNAITALDARGSGRAGLAGISGMAGMQAALGMEALQGMAQAQMPAGVALDPSQMAMIQQMMGPPASPGEALTTLDEMADIGLLPAPIHSEMKQCMVLLPQAAPTMGMAIGMLRPMLPQLRQAREQMHALPPAEQDELAATIVQELQAAPAADRKLFIETLDGGFFPPRVADAVKAKLGGR